MAEKFTATCEVPARTVYNYVTKKNDVIVPAYVADVEITLSVADVARRLGPKAAANASRKTRDAGGTLVVKVTSPAPAAVRPITDEHRWMSAEDRAAAVAAFEDRMDRTINR